MTKTKESSEAPQPEAQADPFEHLVPGRIVHYHPSLHESRSGAPGPWAAMVTAVNPDVPGVVTLNLNLPAPTPVGVDPVQRLAEVSFARDGEDKDGRWTWIFPGQAGRYKPDRTA